MNNQIETNLQNIILSNSNKLLSEIYNSPQMYAILIEEKTRTRPGAQEILPVLFQCAMMDENFVKRNYHVLMKESTTQEEKDVILNDLIENVLITEFLGTIIKGLVKGWGWVKVAGKWVWKQLAGETGKIPGSGFIDEFQPAIRKPGGWKWNEKDPRQAWPAGIGPGHGPGGSPPPKLPNPWARPQLTPQDLTPINNPSVSPFPGIGSPAVFEENQKRK
jgi:hypothetical protein